MNTEHACGRKSDEIAMSRFGHFYVKRVRTLSANSSAKRKKKVEGPYANEGNLYIDNDAKCTLGNVRSLYLVKEPRCLRCPGGGRFVPVDQDIPFIRLAEFQVDYGKYDMAVKAAMLASWPSSSAKFRKYKK